jgi:two-component system sensor histidine kinase VicK
MPAIPIDPPLMRMVVQNILSNAIKYTANGGRITISLDWQPGRSSTAKKPSRSVLMTIQDTGLGIPTKQQPMVFTKLFRADNVRKQETTGTGLGLYIAKAVIEQSGGRIWFTSTENKGTTFFITLPSTGMKKRVGSHGLAIP